MTFDYADFADEDFGDGETAVTLSLEGVGDLGHGCDDAVTFVTRALGGDVTLRFTLPPEDTLDLVARVVRYTADDPRRVREAVEHALSDRASWRNRAGTAEWTLRDDVELARLDWDQGDPDLVARSTYEAARSIRDSLRLPEYPGDERVWTWIDHGDAQSAAYRRVLAATDEEVEALRD